MFLSQANYALYEVFDHLDSIPVVSAVRAITICSDLEIMQLLMRITLPPFIH
jgi:hypothetical protein